MSPTSPLHMPKGLTPLTLPYPLPHIQSNTNTCGFYLLKFLEPSHISPSSMPPCCLYLPDISPAFLYLPPTCHSYLCRDHSVHSRHTQLSEMLSHIMRLSCSPPVWLLTIVLGINSTLSALDCMFPPIPGP